MDKRSSPAAPLEPIAARMPAEPGWRAVMFQRDASGERIPFLGRENCFTTHEVPIATWGLLLRRPEPGMGCCAIGADGARLDTIDAVCLAYPDETSEQAIARTEAFLKEYGKWFGAGDRGGAERGLQDK